MTCRFLTAFLVGGAIFAGSSRGGDGDLKKILSERILADDLTIKELQTFLGKRLPATPKPDNKEAWTNEAARLREALFANVVFRGAAADWRKAKTKVEWLDVIPGGPGYQLKKVRFEALPGLWIPALLYEPEKLSGKVPATLNVMGHDPNSKDVAYQQIRCINLAKRGMLALNVEWFNFGQLSGPGYKHGAMNQIDLCGSSGLAPFYLSLERSLNVLLSHPHADPARVAVSGLSGGGWQTIWISALDTRVTLSNPVAGYSSFRTRIKHFKDLGDSEQTPCDMATIADYDHLTAMLAPRAALLTYNARDNCCFEAGYALPPLEAAAGPAYKLFDRAKALRSHVNYDPGTHNFDQDNRQAFYRMVGEHFFPMNKAYANDEIECDKEVKPRKELNVPLPKNLDFQQLALALAERLPREPALPRTKEKAAEWQTAKRKLLREVLRLHDVTLLSESGHKTNTLAGGPTVAAKQFSVDGLTVPVLEITQGPAKGTTLVLADAGRAGQADVVAALLKSGQRVLLMDPLFLGESHIASREYLWGLMIDTVGQRPLGLQALQITSALREYKTPVHIKAIGERAALIALTAAALETKAIASVEVSGSLGSLKQIIEENRTYDKAPEMFCFGLLEEFDIKQLAALIAPRPVRFVAPSERVRTELAELAAFYRALGSDVELFGK